MTLFALTDISGARIIRFPMSQELSAEIAWAFEAQLAAFESGIVEHIKFDGRYRPEKDELLYVDDFVDVDGLGAAVANPMTIDQFDPNQHSLERVKALFTSIGEGEETRILIQLFERRRLLASKGLVVFFTGNSFQKLESTGLTLDTKLLAVLQGKKICFQSFHYLARVFEMADHFKEATAEEVEKFASHASLLVQNAHQFSQSANSLARKKIALILQSGILDSFTPQQIVDAAQNFNVIVQTAADGRIVLPESGPELRRFLRFLDEDYYESALTQTRFLSNSKRVAD